MKNEAEGTVARAKLIAQSLSSLFLVTLASGFLHQELRLITPLVFVNVLLGIALLTIVLSTTKKFAPISVLAFLLPFFSKSPLAYSFVFLAIIAILFRSDDLFRNLLILFPGAFVEGTGLAIPLRLTIALSIVLAILTLKIRSFQWPSKPLLALILLVSSLLLTISFSPVDLLTSAKEGSIAYDAYHHSVGVAFFENDSMVHATMRYLRSLGHDTLIIREPISPKLLENVSLLVIETPEKPYNQQEISAIVEFVRKGGSLFILGDHTNIFSCYENLNPLLEEFGILLNFDYSMLWEPHFTSLLGTDVFEETAGATLSVKKWDSCILYSLRYTTWADQGDWEATEHVYMGDLLPGKEDSFGYMPVYAMTWYGDGKVLVSANSDVFSGANLIHNYETMCKIVDLLKKRKDPLKSTLSRAVLALLLIFGMLRARSSSIKPISCGLLLGLLLLQAYALSSPDWIPEENLIALDVGHGNADGFGPPHIYKAVFLVIFAQHYGFNPILVKEVPEDIHRYRAFITMGPTKPFSKEELERIESYVKSGGILIVFDGRHAETPLAQGNEAANSLLSCFDMRLGEPIGEVSYFGNTSWNYTMAYWFEARQEVSPTGGELMKGVNGNITVYSALEVIGGNPLATWRGKAVISEKDYGSGKVLVIGDHTVLRDFVKYEPVFSFPDPELKQFIENIFSILLGGEEQKGD